MALLALTFRDGPVITAAVFVAVYLVLFLGSNGATRQSIDESLIAGLGVYLGANVLGWLSGIKSPVASGRVSGYETTSPFFSERVAFPFSISINEPPYIAGAFLVAVIAMIKMKRRPRLFYWFGAAGALFVLLAANNRMAVAVTALLTAGILLASGATRKAAPYLLGTGLLLPIYFTQLQPILTAIANSRSANSFLQRSGRGFIAFEGRAETWAGFIRFLTQRSPDFSSFLFGYGYRGHVKSGAYLYVPRENSLFLADRTFLHSHNSLLQAFLDAGIIGAGILFVVGILLIYRLGRNSELLPIFSVATVIVSAGIIEANLAPGINVATSCILLSLVYFTPNRSLNGPPTPELADTTLLHLADGSPRD